MKNNVHFDMLTTLLEYIKKKTMREILCVRIACLLIISMDDTCLTCN